MHTLETIDGDQYIRVFKQDVIFMDAATRGSFVGNHTTFPITFRPIIMDAVQRGATISLYSVNLGGSIRPTKKPDLGFIYPRRLT